MGGLPPRWQMVCLLRAHAGPVPDTAAAASSGDEWTLAPLVNAVRLIAGARHDGVAVSHAGAAVADRGTPPLARVALGHADCGGDIGVIWTFCLRRGQSLSGVTDLGQRFGPGKRGAAG